MKKVSVIMPVYNVEKYVRESIESVLSQDYREFELIIINDGATDGSGRICNEYLHDARVKYYVKANGGLSSARNEGLKYITGDYVTFIDSDDCFAPGYISTLVRLKEETSADLAVASYHCFTELSNADPSISRKIKMFDGKHYVRAMFGPQMIGAYAWGKLFDSSAFRGRAFPEGRLYEDILTTPYIIYDMKKIAYSCSELYLYRQREGSILQKYTPSRSDELYAISRIVDYGIKKHDRILTWYARINEVRSYLEIRHRFRKHAFDFSSLNTEYTSRVRKDFLKAFVPFML